MNALIAQGDGEAAKLVDQLLNAATNAEGVASAAGGISGAIEPGVASALRLAEALGISLERARLLSITQANMRDAKVYSGRGGDPRQFMEGGSGSDYESSLDYTPVSEHIENLTPKLTSGKSGGSSKSRRSGGGGKSEAEREADREENRLLAERDRILRALETPMEEYQRQLADLNRLQAMGEITGEKYSAALAKLDEELMQAEFGAIIDGIESVSDAMANAIVHGESMGEALGSVFQGIAADLLSSGIREALMSVLGPTGGGGGLWGSILGAFGGGGARADGSAIAGAVGSAISGARAAGGPVRAGEAYRINEHTANSEIFVPSRSGAILNASQAQRAMAGTAGGGAQSVRVELVGGDLALSDSGQIVAKISAKIDQASAATEQRTLGKVPGHLAEQRRRIGYG